MSDIVERLRSVGRDYDFHENAYIYEAADEIERLRKEKERADILCEAIRHAIEYAPDGLSWLNDWFHGDPQSMQELRSYRGKP